MKTLISATLLALLAVPAIAPAPLQAATAQTLIAPDDHGSIDRRGGRCVNREGSACGGV
jgi:hypothetical protein